jgi:hypothetical protein
MALDTIRRIKWKNIFGLVLLITITALLVLGVLFLGALIYGDCVEEKGVKVCFSVDKTTLEPSESANVTTRVTNVGKTTQGAVISMSLSPNLENASATLQNIPAMAPGDTVERRFAVRAKGEVGSFKVSFDIDLDGASEKDIYLAVK